MNAELYTAIDELFELTQNSVSRAKADAVTYGEMYGPWWARMDLPHLATVYRLKLDADRERAK